jgi:hypothetical protein
LPRFVFRLCQGEQRRAFHGLNEDIQVAFFGVGLGQDRSEHTRMRETVAIQNPSQCDPVNGKGFRWLHD